jgi:hypothetical protein
MVHDRPCEPRHRVRAGGTQPGAWRSSEFREYGALDIVTRETGELDPPPNSGPPNLQSDSRARVRLNENYPWPPASDELAQPHELPESAISPSQRQEMERRVLRSRWIGSTRQRFVR